MVRFEDGSIGKAYPDAKIDPTLQILPPPVQTPAPAPTLSARQIAVKAATTLSAFYAAIGYPLASVEIRATLYENYRLGAKSTYVGSAEQNNRLLAVLKANEGV